MHARYPPKNCFRHQPYLCMAGKPRPRPPSLPPPPVSHSPKTAYFSRCVRCAEGARAWLRAGGGNILLIPAKSQQIRAVLYSFDYNRHILCRTRRAAAAAIPSSLLSLFQPCVYVTPAPLRHNWFTDGRGLLTLLIFVKCCWLPSSVFFGR